jgi:hypothetical protein
MFMAIAPHFFQAFDERHFRVRQFLLAAPSRTTALLHSLEIDWLSDRRLHLYSATTIVARVRSVPLFIGLKRKIPDVAIWARNGRGFAVRPATIG